MKRDQILNTIKDLARSQGSYGRMLHSIEQMDEYEQDQLWATLEAENFKEPVDFILYIEG